LVHYLKYRAPLPNGWDNNGSNGVKTMDILKWERLTEVQGRLEAELIESFLEANGVDVELIQESVGHSSFPVMVDGLGRVQIFVSKDKVEEGRELLREFTEGSNQEA
jgi:hypothetical protein